MERGSLFEGLPPPSAPPLPSLTTLESTSEPLAAALRPTAAAGPSILKKVRIEPAKPPTKRPAPNSQNEGAKQVRFKTTVETSKEQVIEAMHKIAAHIANPAKFSKASKLVLQLLEAGSVTKETSEPFFELLQVAMSPPSKANVATVRADYSALFSAVHDRVDCFTTVQQEQVEVWLLWAQLANDFHTDDTFTFSRAAGRLKQAISSLPEATADEEISVTTDVDVDTNNDNDQFADCRHEARPEDVDPFGLNALLPERSKKEEKFRKKKEDDGAARWAQELLRERREALLECLRIACSRYKQQWAQTIIDITAKQAFENINKFTSLQREALQKLWTSVREQQLKRKQGRSALGKLDVTSFERDREKYANEKISIRKAVGSSGERSAEQWLG